MPGHRSGPKDCQWAGPKGETCKQARSRDRPCQVKQCPSCGTRILCRRHCGCEGLEGASAPRGPASVLPTAGPAPGAGAALPAVPAPDAPRDRSRSPRTEGRVCSRDRIESVFRRDHRGRDWATIELPGPGRADHGIVPGRVWGDAELAQEALDLLESSRYRQDRTHSSVHLTLFLRWAER